MNIQLCPHKANPRACPLCFHLRAQGVPIPGVTVQAARVNPLTGEVAFDAPPQIQKGVTRGGGYTAMMPDTSQAPQGEPDVKPSAETSGKVAVVDGTSKQEQKKQVAAPVPADQQRQLQPEYHEPQAEPEQLTASTPARGDLIDRLPRHPDAERARR